MSKYHLKQKQKHYPVTREAVSVVEYMLMQEHDNDDHFLVLNLTNHSNMTILNADYEIQFFDSDDTLIHQAKYHFDALNCGPFKSVVPLEKIRTNPMCAVIKAKLIHAESEEKVWNDGAWSNKAAKAPEVKKYATLFKIPINHKVFHYPIALPIGLLTFFIAVVYILYWVLQVYEPS